MSTNLTDEIRSVEAAAAQKVADAKAEAQDLVIRTRNSAALRVKEAKQAHFREYRSRLAQVEAEAAETAAQAVEQGKTAGANAAGDSLEYTPVPAALTFHGMNTALFAAGDNGRNPNLYYKTVEFRDMGKEQYRKYYFLNNRMSGVILMGDLSRMAAMTEALENHATYQEVMEN